MNRNAQTEKSADTAVWEEMKVKQDVDKVQTSLLSPSIHSSYFSLSILFEPLLLRLYQFPLHYNSISSFFTLSVFTILYFNLPSSVTLLIHSLHFVSQSSQSCTILTFSQSLHSNAPPSAGQGIKTLGPARVRVCWMRTLQGHPLVPNIRMKGIVRCVIVLYEIREKDKVNFCCRERHACRR